MATLTCLSMLSFTISDSCGESVGSSTIDYRANWRVNHSLQANHFIGRPVEEVVAGGLNNFH